MQADDLQLLVIREMPFGKYKGRVIADLPGNYLNWFARKGFAFTSSPPPSSMAASMERLLSTLSGT